MKIRWQSHIFWLLVLLGHAVFAVAWWWLMPHGFPPAHPRFWVNEFLPWATVAAVIGVAVAAQRDRLLPARLMLVMLATLWLTAGLYGRGIFPVSFGTKWLLLVAGGVVIAFAAADPAFGRRRMPIPAAILTALAGVALGVWLLRAERGEDPSTHPIELASLSMPTTLPAAEEPLASQFLRGADVKPATGVITMQRGPYVFAIQPMLSFGSRSEDRCWTCFAPEAARTPVERKLNGFQSVANGVDLTYVDLGRSLLRVRDTPDAGFITVDALTTLPQAVYSHLNTYAQFEFAGHRDVEVTFSPCPDQRIAITRIEALEKILYNQVTHDATFVRLAGRVAERETEIIVQNESRLLRCPSIVLALFMNKQARMSSVNRAIELCARNNVRVEGIPAFDEIAKSIQEDPTATDPAVADAGFEILLQKVAAVSDEDLGAAEEEAIVTGAHPENAKSLDIGGGFELLATAQHEPSSAGDRSQTERAAQPPAPGGRR